MKLIALIVVLFSITSCFYVTAPEAPKVEPAGPNGVSEYKLDWSGLMFYLAQIAAAVRWAIVEWKHRKLLMAGKKDNNRDGVEDKA